MRPTLPALRSWGPHALVPAADDLTRVREGLEHAADDVVRRIDTTASSWTGPAAERARERAVTERSGAVRLAASFGDLSAALARGAGELGSARQRVLDLVAAAQADGLTVDASGAVRTGGIDGLDIAAWVRDLLAAKVHGSHISAALNDVDQADHALALALASAVVGVENAAALVDSAPVVGEPGKPGGPHFVIGPPTRPDFTWDEDFEYDSQDGGFSDWIEKEKWLTKMDGASLLRPDLDDAINAYRHYWSNTGDPLEVDYEEAYREDSAVRTSVDEEILRAQRGAEDLIRSGQGSFSMSGDASAASEYPSTENWQKTLGGYQQWSSADVSVSGSTVTMTVTVHAEDHYNFNRGQADIASGASDDGNGRFTEIGWARPFDTHGSVTRTVTWELGDVSGAETTGGDPERDPGGEDRADERESSGTRFTPPGDR